MNERGLKALGITNPGGIHWNLSTPRLYEEVIRRHEGRLAHLGPLVVTTGHYTGRSPDDKFVVRRAPTERQVSWGNVNRPMPPETFEALRRRLAAYLQGRDLFVQDCFAGADPKYRVPLRVVTESAWHNLFARNMFLQARPEELADHVPQLSVIHVPGFLAIPEIDGTRSEVFVILDFDSKMILIGGTSYAGEIKKSVFTALNFLLPERGVLPMHCAANVGKSGDVAIFLGLSGTGKTTLSTDPDRLLVGDDEIGWSDSGVFNFEGGCYAKVIRLSREDEPEIYQTTRRFGTILENVSCDPETGRLDLNDASLTENTRASYPVKHLTSIQVDGVAGHPRNVVMLTADAFGVLPPLSRLSKSQAMYHFLTGYTAKVAGTERGVTEPKATFSPCFGAPFMPRSAVEYAKLLGERLQRHQTEVWLLNTGWTGGGYGEGHRIKLAATRSMLRAALAGALSDVPTWTDPIFGLQVPTSCPGVEPKQLRPRDNWADGAAYDAHARKLAAMFAENFRQFEHEVDAEVVRAGPNVAAGAHP